MSKKSEALQNLKNRTQVDILRIWETGEPENLPVLRCTGTKGREDGHPDLWDLRFCYLREPHTLFHLPSALGLLRLSQKLGILMTHPRWLPSFPIEMLCLELPHLVLPSVQGTVSGLENPYEQRRKVHRSAQYETVSSQKSERYIFLVEFNL